jgi:PAS domain S-box-containing protein
MKKNPHPPADDAELRHRAEERLGEQRKSQKSEAGDPGTAEDTARLVHELQVHQIELEMQNEELQQAHAQVETLLAQYTDLYDLAPAGYLTFDREGAIRQVNLTGARLLGVECSRLVNRRFGLFVAKGDQRAFSDFLQKVFASQAKESCEITLLHESSQPVVVQIEGTHSADGQECRAVVVDLTERKRAEEELRDSEEKFRGLFESSRDAIMTLEPPAWRFTSGNPATVKMFGAKNEAEFISHGPWELSPDRQPDGRASAKKVREMIETAVREGFHFFEWTHRRIGGEEFPADVLLTRMEWGGIQSTVRDVTERKRAETALIRLAAIVESSDDAIIGKDLNGIITNWNRGAEKIYGYTAGEMVGTSIMRLIPADRHDEENQILETIKRGESMKHFETLRQTKDGRLIDVSVTASPIRDATGKTIGVSKVARDITQRRTLEAQFRQAQKLEGIGQLAAGVAHDFNNMLAVIQLQASLLKAGEGLSSQQLESASEIEKATERAANLTRQLLLFSRRQTMQLRDLDLNQSINDMTKMLRRTLGETIQVQFKFAMQPLFMHADAGMLDQVLMNLAVNAHDAMPKGGLLIIETSAVEFDESVRAQSPLARSGSFVCLSVGDTGCGIPPENLPRIFEPFFTTKDVGKGTGLGLATVFGIVQQHQGWINVYSEVGRGTIFRIYLPRLAAKSGQESGQPVLATVRGGKETILLVEDEGALRSSMHKALLQLGYHVLESVSGGEALKVWEHHRNRIDLLVTDMVMPGGVTGKDLAERFLKENPKLKVIYTSGYSVELAGRDFPLEEGVNFLAKPFGADKLAQTVREKLDANN